MGDFFFFFSTLQGENSPVKPSAVGRTWRSENEEKGRGKGDAEECLRGSRLSRLLDMKSRG